MKNKNQFIKDNEESLYYLFNLRESGVTNMFGAAAYLERDLGLNKKTAKEVLLFWMSNFKTVAEELGVEV